MTKKNNANSARRKLIPAVGMLVVSAMMLSSSTYAWFTMNETVTVSGMQMKAKAENGIVVSNAADGTYSFSANSVKTDVAELYPGSTANLTTFLHSKSNNPAAANTQLDYTVGTEWANNTTRGNYVIHDFYIKAAADEAITCTSLNVDSVTATLATGSTAATQDLSKALRVGVKFDNSTNYYIYAPVTGYTQTVSVQNAAGAYNADTSARTSVTALAGNTQSSDTAVTSIPQKSTNAPIHASVYIWYEGEDAACISNNLEAALEALSVSVEFGYSAPAQSQTP